MLDFFVSSVIILIASTLARIPLYVATLIVIFFGVAWLLTDDDI